MSVPLEFTTVLPPMLFEPIVELRTNLETFSTISLLLEDLFINLLN